MTTAHASEVNTSGPNEFGYNEFSLGNFSFRRDEYFAHVTWPTGSHTLSIDAF